MNILILEDDIYSYYQLCSIITDMLPDSNIIGPMTSVKSCSKFFQDNKEPLHLIITDVNLEDGTAFTALDEAPPEVPVVFTTSHEEYALRAFDYNSLAYLIKPIDEARLKKALRKALGMEYRERFIVNTFKGEKVVSVDDIRYFVSENKLTYIVLNNGTSFNVDLTLTAIDAQLNPKRFMRVNRKYIVPVNMVDILERDINGKERLKLKPGKKNPEIIISRDNKQNVHNWIDGCTHPK
jgi:DNA-binding LytR/AlgR family response regulator